MNKIYGNKKCYSRRKRFRPTRLGNIYVLEKRKRNAENKKFSKERRHIFNSLTSSFLKILFVHIILYFLRE